MSRSFIVLVSSALFLLPACGPAGEDLTPHGSDSEGESVAETSAALTNRSVVGNWVSPSCGGRTYPRKIQFTSDGRFIAQDLISPCPPKTACLWSGIVTTVGTFTVDADSIDLAIRESGTMPVVTSFPTSLALSRTNPVPVEIVPEQSVECVYARDNAVKSP